MESFLTLAHWIIAVVLLHWGEAKFGSKYCWIPAIAFVLGFYIVSGWIGIDYHMLPLSGQCDY